MLVSVAGSPTASFNQVLSNVQVLWTYFGHLKHFCKGSDVRKGRGGGLMQELMLRKSIDLGYGEALVYPRLPKGKDLQ
ncbi:hypothetical protein QTO34_002736 [Cnephaeus nilssonii]|uniref:Uncharacterized protein n=1 Tax=Cnephaeus nilssonii TaxID=3371016 RepID=A0AA40HSP4_CNENI|nr:hypothetical protein QTO34_002736 [Eptesicus nilssonii]